MKESPKITGRSSGWSTKDEKLERQKTTENEEDKEYFLNFQELEDYHKNNEEEVNNSQDVRISNEYYNRIIVVEFISVLLSAYGIVLAIVLNELVLERDITVYDEQWVFYYIMAMSLMLCLTLYFRYELYLKWYVTRGLLTEYDNLISTGWWQNMVLE
jgi:hypothetical protein